MTVESGNTRETLVRLTIVTLACAVFCGMFLRDGFVKYPRENAEFAREDFPEPTNETPLINPLVTEEALDKVHKNMSLEELEEFLGEPAYNNGVEVFWVGKVGYIRVKLSRAGLVEQSVWKQGKRTATDLHWQVVGAVLTGLLTVVFVVLLIRAAGTKVVLDEKGLTCNRGETIAWDQMRSLDTSLYKRKGWVMLHFERGGTTGQQKLHSFHIAKFKEIVGEICARKSFESPFAEPPAGQDAGDAAQTPSA